MRLRREPFQNGKVFLLQSLKHMSMLSAKNIVKPLGSRSTRAISQIVGQIGHTPLLELKRIGADVAPVKILAKAEWFNPGGSVKDRAALNIILDGERSGQLTADKTILDATSGNTGIAYSLIGAVLGYKVKLSLPANAGETHKQILKAYGAELVLTNPQKGSDGAIVEARKIYENDPQRYFYADQYNNPANWKAHYNGTALEILNQTDYEVTHFVAGLGTTGTFVGCARRFRLEKPSVKLISFQPNSPLHGLEGMKHLATAIVPGIYEASLSDEDLTISTEEAQQMAMRLAREEGLLVGTSAGAAAEIALRVACQLRQGVVVTIFPDSGRKDLDQNFWRQVNYGN